MQEDSDVEDSEHKPARVVKKTLCSAGQATRIHRLIVRSLIPQLHRILTFKVGDMGTSLSATMQLTNKKKAGVVLSVKDFPHQGLLRCACCVAQLQLADPSHCGCFGQRSMHNAASLSVKRPSVARHHSFSTT